MDLSTSQIMRTSSSSGTLVKVTGVSERMLAQISGSAAFFALRRKRQPRVLTPEVLKHAQELLAEGQPRSAVARTLELKPDTLSKAVRAGRLVELLKKTTAPAQKANAT